MRQHLIVAFAALMLAGCGQAHIPMAAVSSGAGPKALAAKAKTPEAVLKKFDADADDRISREEFDELMLVAARRAVETAEEDLEEALEKGKSQKQINACRAHVEHAKLVLERSREVSGERFSLLDADDSGHIEREELTPDVVKALTAYLR